MITPEGVIQSNKRKVSLTNAEVWEYGFSKAVWELCPDDWKKPLGNDWQDVLSIILFKTVSNFLYPENTDGGKRNRISDISLQLSHHPCPAGSIKKWGVGMAELHRLETIYLVCLDKNEIISKVNKEQQELLKRSRCPWKCAERTFLTEKLIHYFQADPGLSMRQRKKNTILQKCWYVSPLDSFAAGQQSAGALMVQKPSGRAAETYGIKTRDRFAFYHYTNAVRH